MKSWIAAFVTMLATSTLSSPATARSETYSERLRPVEYDTVALIYNEDLGALGDKALYPICIGAPADTPLKPLVRYLQRGGYPILDFAICNPSGKHPKDFPHGLQIYVDHPQRHPDGAMDLAVVTGDLTMRPGVHFALMLRKGIYHFKRNKNKAWEIVGYTKEYDFRDPQPPSRPAATTPCSVGMAHGTDRSRGSNSE
ncbi:MAG TPA: hypothetical protein VKZ53_30065 [Candidatus Angelobacter sp.]|nr:hypothetical protein [Candidatus Angelobacter sp.]